MCWNLAVSHMAAKFGFAETIARSFDPLQLKRITNPRRAGGRQFWLSCLNVGGHIVNAMCPPNASARYEIVTFESKFAHALQLFAVIGGRLADQLFEGPIEMREGLEPHFIGNLADAQIRVQEQVL